MGFYSFVFKNFLARLDPEKAHHLGFLMVQGIGFLPESFTKSMAPDPTLKVHALGLEFASPFGLAAGFDKNAVAIKGLTALGFGHVEVGTLTAHAQPGNPKPRMFRLVADRGIINRMGFNNNGSQAAIAHLQKARMRAPEAVIGVNIGKSKITDVADAAADYVTSAKRLAHYADYMVVNVSSPNTPGLRGLQELRTLEPLLAAVKEAVQGKPLLVKIAPDMPDEQIIEIVELVSRLKLAGIIATNTTIARTGLTASQERIKQIGDGGLSGAPLKDRSLEVLRVINAHAKKDICVISVGGVTTARDVQDRLDAGATLVQGYSAFVYEGPLWAAKINRELLALRR